MTDVPNLPTIDILYGGLWMEILVDDYVINFGNGVGAFCIDQTGGDNLANLGAAFMRNYYIILDQTQMKMGFTPLTGVATVK